LRGQDPALTFEKFPSASPVLTISMKSVGEVMAIGRTFKEALQKGLRSLEIKKSGLESLLFKDARQALFDNVSLETIHENLRTSTAERIFHIADAFRLGIDLEKIYELTSVDRWFLHNIKEITDLERKIAQSKGNIDRGLLAEAKQFGFSDKQLAGLLDRKEEEIFSLRKSLDIEPAYKLVDTCAAEFEAFTPYYYSSYDR